LAAPNITWIEKGISHAGAVIRLGVCQPSAKSTNVEPVAAIEREGKPVAGAMVFVQLLAAIEGKKAGGDSASELTTVYKPGGEKTPAIYSPGKLARSKSGAEAIARFRIVLPGVDEDFVRDIVIPAG
jgi:hypothetical protein